MPTTSIAQARKDAHSICSKGECSIVQKSNPEELRNLTLAQIRNQIKLSEKYYKKHQDNYKRIGGGHKKSPDGISEQHHIKLKMSLMEDARKRFEKQLKAASKQTPKVKVAAKKGRSSLGRTRLNA